jgi:hypothetical protein
MKIRRATMSDLKAYDNLQAERWADDNRATYDNLLSRLTVHPQGMLVAEEHGRVVGMVYAMRLASYDYDNPPSWYEVTNDGSCDNHVPNGEIIFGVDLSTARDVGARAGDALLLGIAKLAVRENIKWCMLGGRLPGYHNYSEQMTADEYLWSKDSVGRPLDAQVRFYTSIPGLKAVKVLPNYFKDPESLDYGVLLRWHNPLYGFPLLGLWSALFPVLFKLEEGYMALRRRIRRR